MPQAKITSKGQITLPREVRERLHLQTGDRVEFILEPDGRVLLQPSSHDVHELRGLLRREGRTPVSVEEMDAAIRRRSSRMP